MKSKWYRLDTQCHEYYFAVFFRLRTAFLHVTGLFRTSNPSSCSVSRASSKISLHGTVVVALVHLTVKPKQSYLLIYCTYQNSAEAFAIGWSCCNSNHHGRKGRFCRCVMRNYQQAYLDQEWSRSSLHRVPQNVFAGKVSWGSWAAARVGIHPATRREHYLAYCGGTSATWWLSTKSCGCGTGVLALVIIWLFS